MTDALKRSGLKLGLGLLSIGRAWSLGRSPVPTEDEAQALLADALSFGIAIFDTAPAYATSEARLGRFLGGVAPAHRASLLVMTKAGEHWDHDRGTSFVDHGRDALIRSIDRSLRLLGSVDVLQIHKATRDVVAHPDTVAGLEHARRCGVKAFGASVSDTEAGLRALEAGHYDALQFPLNLSNTDLLPLLPALAAHGRTAIFNRPFAMGGLIAGGPFEESARAAFRFVERHAPDGIVLTGTGRTAHLAQNAAAFRSRNG